MIKDLPKIEEGDFREVINSAIAEGRHIDYLQEVLKNYEWYEKEFAKVFTANGEPTAVYIFRVTYERKPKLWREIEILGSQNFEKLAKMIVSGMKWNYDHMHGFTIPGIEKKSESNLEFFEPSTLLEFFAEGWEDDPFPTYKSNEIKICQIDYLKHPILDFIFDFGDGHEFQIIYKGTRAIKSSEKKTMFPAITDQRGIAPKQYPVYR
ncbi:MAG: hypothetical protein PHY72_03505 [Candidatus Pacebacteria bacterium]|nr:hypothetical protein [Candidatus Paceibacterota bacterium]